MALVGVYLLAGVSPLHGARWFLDKETVLWVELVFARFFYSSASLLAICFFICASLGRTPQSARREAEKAA